MSSFEIKTSKRYELVNITQQVEQIVRETKIENSLVLVFVPHSTAGIVLTEDEPGLKKDWLDFLKKKVAGFDFEHSKIDNNADSHILSGLVGQGKTLMVENGRLVRGIWQDIFLAEFDGPRTRKIKIGL
ncbi:YjbQ family protein [Candidatus Woesearchaeota archaeon]|nr:YjbQ family protein [Candidatus Woesearchaeota archaeon]